MNAFATPETLDTITELNQSARRRDSFRMATAPYCRAIWLAALFALPAGSRAADFELTAAEVRSVEDGRYIIRAALDPGERRGTVRAAMLVAASPQVVFDMMTSCKEAFGYVPHLRRCKVRETAPDGSWQLVEQRIDFGWYAPAVEWLFRAEFVAGRSIRFKQVSGDFKSNEGIWEFEPTPAGHTLLRYRAYIDPPGYIPNWLARSTFKRELPQMLTDLKRHCEVEQRSRARNRAESAPAAN